MKRIIASVVAMLATVSMMACGSQVEVDKNEGEITTTTSATTTTVTTIVTTTNITTSEVTTENVTEESVSETVNETGLSSAKTDSVEGSETILSEIITEKCEETTNSEPKNSEEYIVYKPSTKFLHRNSCRWNNGDAYRVDCTTDLVARLCDECCPDVSDYIEYVEPEPETPSSDGMTFVGYFGRVTYYPATAYYDGVCGGSGRTLLGYGDYGNGIRGSIASRSLYEMYGYNYNGRTTVYLEFPGYEIMNGLYHVDDCCASYGVIDVFVWSGSSCPFYSAGVIEANCYI